MILRIQEYTSSPKLSGHFSMGSSYHLSSGPGKIYGQVKSPQKIPSATKSQGSWRWLGKMEEETPICNGKKTYVMVKTMVAALDFPVWKPSPMTCFLWFSHGFPIVSYGIFPAKPICSAHLVIKAAHPWGRWQPFPGACSAGGRLRGAKVLERLGPEMRNAQWWITM